MLNSISLRRCSWLHGGRFFFCIFIYDEGKLYQFENTCILHRAFWRVSSRQGYIIYIWIRQRSLVGWIGLVNEAEDVKWSSNYIFGNFFIPIFYFVSSFVSEIASFWKVREGEVFVMFLFIDKIKKLTNILKYRQHIRRMPSGVQITFSVTFSSYQYSILCHRSSLKLLLFGE